MHLHTCSYYDHYRRGRPARAGRNTHIKMVYQLVKSTLSRRTTWQIPVSQKETVHPYGDSQDRKQGFNKVT